MQGPVNKATNEEGCECMVLWGSLNRRIDSVGSVPFGDPGVYKDTESVTDSGDREA